MAEAALRIDGHLDVACHALAVGRDLSLPPDPLRRREGRVRETAMVTWPEMRRTDVAVVFGTPFAKPDKGPRPARPLGSTGEPPADAAFAGHRGAEGAHAQAPAQLDGYEAVPLAHRPGLLGENWLAFLRRVLPPA